MTIHDSLTGKVFGGEIGEEKKRGKRRCWARGDERKEEGGERKKKMKEIL